MLNVLPPPPPSQNEPSTRNPAFSQLLEGCAYKDPPSHMPSYGDVTVRKHHFGEFICITHNDPCKNLYDNDIKLLQIIEIKLVFWSRDDLVMILMVILGNEQISQVSQWQK